MRWLRYLFSALLVSGLSAFACPEVARADAISLAGSTMFRMVYANQSQILNDPQTYLYPNQLSDSFASDSWLSVHDVSVADGYSSFSATSNLSGTGSFTGNGTTYDSWSGSVSGVGSGNGSISGSYDNPSSVLGDTLYYSGSTYNNVGYSLTGAGTSSGSITGSGSGSYSSSENTQGTSNNSSHATYWREVRPTANKVNLSNNNVITMVFKIEGFGQLPADTALMISGFYRGHCKLHKDNGTDLDIYTGNNVFVMTSTGSRFERVDQATSGRYIPTGNFRIIYVIVPVTQFTTNNNDYDSIFFPMDWQVYNDLDYQYSENIISHLNSDTNSINNNITQQTQNQTTQLKDTTGSDSILSSGINVGDNLVNNLGFVAQTASFVSDSIGAITNTTASATVHFPGIKVQENVIAREQDVNILGWFPSELETTIRTFGTLLFTLAWINGLRRMYEKIFGGEKVVEVDTE